MFSSNAVAIIICSLPIIGASRQSEANTTSLLQSLSLEEKVGQMLQVSLYADGEEATGRTAVATRVQAGSVVMRDHTAGPNLIRPQAKTAAKTFNEVQSAAKVPILVAADIERGLIARIEDAPDMPNSMTLGAIDDVAVAKSWGELTAREARAVGIEWALAPVVDVNDNPDNPIIGDRSFGDDPEAAARLTAAYIKGAHAAGLLVTAKHFPGQGDSAADSHTGLVDLTQSREHLEQVEFAPFRAAISAGVDAVMLAHVRLTALEPDQHKLATTSRRVILDTLRGELGFKGVVISDSMEMRGVTDLYRGEADPIGHAVVDAVEAGVDVIMLPDNVDAAYTALLRAVRSGEISESRIDESVKRILGMKQRAGLFQSRTVAMSKVEEEMSRPEDSEFAQRIADESVVLVRANTFALPMRQADRGSSKDKLVVVVFSDSLRSPLGKAFEEEVRRRQPAAQVRHVYYDSRGTQETSDLMSVVQGADRVVAAVFMTSLPGAKRLAGVNVANVFGLNGQSANEFEDILHAASRKTMVVALSSPYLNLKYPLIANYTCTFSISSTSERAAVKALFGEVKNKAILPVSLPGVAQRGFAMAWPQKSPDVRQGGTSGRTVPK